MILTSEAVGRFERGRVFLWTEFADLGKEIAKTLVDPGIGGRSGFARLGRH